MQKSAFALLVLIAIISCSFIEISKATNSNFVVSPQKEHVITVSLQDTDSLSGSFSVVSNDETGISFYIIDPQNQTILRYDNVGQKSFSIIAQTTGDYQMHFDNSVSSVLEKTVALNYDTTHYIMGMPQEQFLFVVIAIVCLIGILVFAILMPK